MKTQKFQVTGMTCAACSAHVEKAVAGVAGVKTVTVSLLMNNMAVEYDEPASPQAICAAVEAAGYGASLASGDNAHGVSNQDALEDRETPRIRRRLIVSVCL